MSGCTIIDFQTRRRILQTTQAPISRRREHSQAAAIEARPSPIPAEALLQIKPSSDLDSILAAPSGFLAWANGTRCDYSVEWIEDEGTLFLWFPKQQVELWLVRSPKLGLVKLKCLQCGHKTSKSRWMYIRLSDGSDDSGCGCTFDDCSRAARLFDVRPDGALWNMKSFCE